MQSVKSMYLTSVAPFKFLSYSTLWTSVEPLTGFNVNRKIFIERETRVLLFLHPFQVPVTEQELKGKSKKKEASKSGDEKDGEKSQASACEGKVGTHFT